ncbi:MAG TPA: DMT family transporter, partial [Streptosporangiaceae bacterium]|nr:DMT family transporter [Streptosporangiaceae bacterium]
LVAVLAAVLGHGVARPVSWLGFGLSLAGVLVIASAHGGGSSLTGDGLVLASQLACAGFIVSQARLLRGRDPVAVTALQLVAAALAVLPAALAGGPVALMAGRPSAVLATAGLVLAGTVLPTTLFAFAQGRVSADVAGAFLNLEPLFGAAIGIVLFGNPLGPAQVAGGAAVVAGIGLSSYQVVRQGQAGRRRGPGRAGARRVARLGLVHLDDIRARSAAGVADPDGQLEIAALAEPRRAVDGVALPGRVPEPMAERVAGEPVGGVAVADQQALGIAEHARRGGRGVRHGTVGLGGRDSHGQPAAGLGPAEQDVGTGGRGVHRLGIARAQRAGQSARRHAPAGQPAASSHAASCRPSWSAT